jgi:excinuclease ABC subunit C
VRALKQTAERNPDALTAVVNKATAEKIRSFFAELQGTEGDLVTIT